MIIKIYTKLCFYLYDLLGGDQEVNLSEAGVSPVIQCSFHTFLIMNSYMKSLLFVLQINYKKHPSPASERLIQL
jgi:hypothetical protein